MTKQERLEKQRQRLQEMTSYEASLRAEGAKYIAGMDEVGRGPLAGPVYAACVVLPEDFDVLGVDDSKKLSAKKRAELDSVIRERAVAYGIGVADNREIDEVNILNATKRAMKRAFYNATEMLQRVNDNNITDNMEPPAIDALLIDALTLDDLEVRQEAIIKGDARSVSIAAASIVAKVARDSFMEEMDEQYPGYGFADNKGYGTAAHYQGIREFGVTPIHRMTFLKNFAEKHAAPAPAGSGGRGTGESGESKAMAKKVYAVKTGRRTGIFETWDECKAQVDGFKGAEYKSFASLDDAWAYLGIAAESVDARPALGEVWAYVDGSYDQATGRYSCGAVFLTADGEEHVSEAFTDAAAAELRNVSGELMGARRAVEYAIRNGFRSVTIYHDYAGIGKWGNDEWKANLAVTKDYKDFIRQARAQVQIDFVKVRAHAGNKYNEIADKLAKAALV